MNRTAKIIPVLILAILMMAGQAFAADGDAYSYRIKVFSGNQGKFADKAKHITYSCKGGGRVRLDIAELDVRCDNEKYFVKGLKEAGTDNSNKSVINSLMVKADEDKDYVVAFGLKKEMVKYTVRYVDESGNELLPDDEYLGSPGDKPVVSFKYIKGYVPTAYNETKTLSQDPQFNVFVFSYNKIINNQEAADDNKAPNSSKDKKEKKTKTDTSNRNTNNNTNTNTNNNTRQTVDQARSLDNRNTNTNDGNANDNNDAQTDQNIDQPKELVDLDDNEVPLASGDTNKDNKGAEGFLTAQTGVIAGVALVVAMILAFLIIRKRRRQAQK